MLFHPDLNKPDIKGDIWSDLLIEQQYTGILASKNKNADTIWVDIIIKPIKNKYGDIIGYSAIMFDITNEIKLKENTQALQKTIGENEARLKIMSETLRTVAHEWRQPLSSISLEAQNLLFSYEIDEELSKDEIIQGLKNMHQKTEDLSNIIHKFQLITETNEENKKWLKLNDIIRRAITMISSEVKVLLKKDLKADIKIFASEYELSSSIASILTNAYEAITNQTQTKEYYIHLKTFIVNENYLHIEISNNAGHISREIKERIFDAYFSTKSGRNGMGLSLYLAKMIVELHLHGVLEAQNRSNDIVTFVIKLPLKDIDHDNNTSPIK
jgi:signal transduction histidine kinase